MYPTLVSSWGVTFPTLHLDLLTGILRTSINDCWYTPVGFLFVTAILEPLIFYHNGTSVLILFSSIIICEKHNLSNKELENKAKPLKTHMVLSWPFKAKSASHRAFMCILFGRW